MQGFALDINKDWGMSTGVQVEDKAMWSLVLSQITCV